jgi:hypothetical protein
MEQARRRKSKAAPNDVELCDALDFRGTCPQWSPIARIQGSMGLA